jgi:hypothetical protein
MTREDFPPTTEVWLATPAAADLFDPSRLDLADRLTWNGLRSPRRRLDWASSRALRQALSEDAGSGWHSSVSHSRGYAAVARSSGDGSIGVDVEWLTPRDFLGMARTAFAPEEARELELLRDTAQLRAKFYEYWTLKEAFAKALRLPLTEALVQCCFADTGSTAARLPTALPWRAVVYAPRERLRLAVASVGELAASAPGTPRTMEWPPGREAAWPVVQKLEGIGTGHLASC